MGHRWKYILALQFPIGTIGDFDRMIALEERIAGSLGSVASMDGHDAGSGEGNIFIHCDDPQATFSKASECVEDHVRDQMKAAYRELEGERYMPLWPPGLKEFHIL